MKYVVLYVGHLYDSFWTIKIRLTWQGGIREGKNLPEKWPQFSFGALQGPLNGSRTPEINSNQSESVGGGHLGSISGVLGTFGGLWGAPKPN